MPTRRRALQCAACACVSFAATDFPAASPAPPALPRLIDVHHHISPPAWTSAMREQILATNRNAEPIVGWTPQRSLDDMDAGGVDTAFLSITNPGIWTADAAAAARLARVCNDYVARVVADAPKRFGAFASLPLPDVEASLAEITHAFDVLKADGIGLMTSYDDKWLGDDAFAPVFEELDRRKAVVFVHPTSSHCCTARIPDVSLSAVEFPIDTTRTVVSLLFSGRLSRCPNIRFIFSHGGAAVPPLAQRIAGILESQPRLRERAPHGALYELRKLFYDTALAANPATMAGLLAFVSPEQVLYGTDYPLASIRATNIGLSSLGLDPQTLEPIAHGNAMRILPARVTPASP